MHRRTYFLLHLLVISFTASAQLQTARAKIDSLVHHARGIVGVAAIDLDSGDTLTVHGNDRFPMQSVFKFPIALAVLRRVDNGSLLLSQPIPVTKADLRADTWSPMREAYPSGNITLPLDSIIRYTVSISDNNGCDILLRLVGGTDSVQRSLRDLGIRDIAITATEAEMHEEWDVQYRNWSTPLAMATLLQRFHEGKTVSRASTEYLRQIMMKSPTGPRRLRGALPVGAMVSHKTGSSGTNEKGIASATNDVGVITLPEGRSAAVAVFVAESDASEEERDAVIAAIARAVWDALAQR